MKALIVVDMQNDFVTGALGTKEAVEILPNVKKKIMEYLDAGHKVIFTCDTHNENYLDTNEGKHLPVPHCVVGTSGWQVVSDIDAPGCVHIRKDTFGYTHWSRWDFHDGDDVEIIGVCTDICVISNALILKAMFPEINITVDASCCAGVTPETHSAALITMKSCQINIIGE